MDTSSILAKQERLKTIQAHIDRLMSIDSKAAQNGDFDEQFKSLHMEMYALMDELAEQDKAKSKLETAADSIEEMSADTLHIYFKDSVRIDAKL